MSLNVNPSSSAYSPTGKKLDATLDHNDNIATTAPNTPEEDSRPTRGSGATMNNHYDPALSQSPFASPSSPLRDSRANNNSIKAVGFHDAQAPKGEGSEGGRASSGSEEEKKESEDVVAKTLAYFDHVCAVPKPGSHVGDPGGGSSSNAAGNKPTLGIEPPTNFPEWGQAPSMTDEEILDEEDETTTNIGSYETSTVNPMSLQTSTTGGVRSNSQKGAVGEGWLSESLSQEEDHENFEVVLDPSSIPPEERHQMPKQQRRWPFSKRGLASSEDSLAAGTEHEAAAAAVSAKTMYPNGKYPHDVPKGKSDVYDKDEEKMEELSRDLDEIARQSSLKHEQSKQKELLNEEVRRLSLAVRADEVTDNDHDPTIEVSRTQKDGGKLVDSNQKEVSVKTKSIMRRFIRKCRKIPQKFSGGRQSSSDRTTNEALNENGNGVYLEFAEEKEMVTQNNKQDLLEEELLQMSSNIECEPIAEENEEEAETSDDNKDREEERKDGSAMVTASESASAAWNSLFASITNTFEDSPAEQNDSDVNRTGLSTADNPPMNESTTTDQKDFGEAGGNETISSVTHTNEKEGGMRWKRLSNIRKSAKNLVRQQKKNTNSKEPEAETTKSQILSGDVPSRGATVTVNPVTQKPKATWKSVVDPTTGKTYYYHRKTRETTWTMPDEFKQYEKDLESWKNWVETTRVTETPTDAKPKSLSAEAFSPNETIESSAVEPTSQMSETEQQSRRILSAENLSNDKMKETPNSQSQSEHVAASRTTPANTTRATYSRSEEKKVTVEFHSSKRSIESKDVFDPEKKKEVERLLKRLPPQKSSIEQMMKQYKGREDDLLDHLRSKVESRPFDEPLDEDNRASSRLLSSKSTPPRSPYQNGTRTMTFLSKASANTRSSALTDRTEKIKNTARGKFSGGALNDTFSSATSLSSRLNEDQYRLNQSTADRIPSRVPVPRERQLMVEELTDARISAETYDGNGQGRGRIMRGKLREHVATFDDPIYDGDNDTDVDNTTAAYETDTYGTDSVSALSENDTDFLHRKDNFDQARRRALDDAIEREDWDLAAAISEGMRAANLPGGYEKAHSSWNQSELDKFIANNDWNAVKSYIARMREASKKSQRQSDHVIPAPRSRSHQEVPLARASSSASRKNLGARSQLQHKEVMSESSWTSDSGSSYETEDDSESDIYRLV